MEPLIENVKRVRDADGALCRDCDAYFDDATNYSLPAAWTWRHSQWMHEGGHHPNGHRMNLFRYV